MSSDESEGRFELRNRKSDPPRGGVSTSDTPPETASAPEPEPVAELTSEPAPAPAAAPRRVRVGRGAWALCALAVVAVALAGWTWREADTDPDRARAALRDQAVIQGTHAVEVMNSMDRRDVPAGVKAWQDVTTGVLHDQLVAIGSEEQKLLVDEAKIAQGRVVQAALTELTDRTATLIVALEVTVHDEAPGESGDTEAGNEPVVKRNRFAADLVLVGGEWKLENIQQVAVGM